MIEIHPLFLFSQNRIVQQFYSLWVLQSQCKIATHMELYMYHAGSVYIRRIFSRFFLLPCFLVFGSSILLDPISIGPRCFLPLTCASPFIRNSGKDSSRDKSSTSLYTTNGFLTALSDSLLNVSKIFIIQYIAHEYLS